MELLNYSAPTTTTYQPEVDSLMKLVTPVNNTKLPQNLARRGYELNPLTSNSLMPTPPNLQSQQPAQSQPQLQPQIYHYNSDNESNPGNASTVSTGEYDYKESYSYIMNPPAGAASAGVSANNPGQVEHYSPVNANSNLASYSHRPQNQAPSTIPAGAPGAYPQTSSTYSKPPQTTYDHNQQQYYQSQYGSQPPGAAAVPGTVPSAMHYEEFKHPKGHSLPDIRPSTYTYEDEPSKYRANSCPVNPYQNPLHSQPYPQEGSSYQQGQQSMLSIQVPSGIDVNQYPDMTTLLNSNSNLLPPPVESQFVDHKSCQICGKRITRDMSRHMRTHQSEARFTCKFPKGQCRHKSGKFNRPYDYKKHLLNRHFKFDDPCVKRLHNLSDKLFDWGTCPCGLRFIGKDWLDKHILTEDTAKKCPIVE